MVWQLSHATTTTESSKIVPTAATGTHDCVVDQALWQVQHYLTSYRKPLAALTLKDLTTQLCSALQLLHSPKFPTFDLATFEVFIAACHFFPHHR